MAKGNKWTSFSGQMAKIADQGRAEREASKAHEAMTSQPDKAMTPSVEATAEPAQPTLIKLPMGMTQEEADAADEALIAKKREQQRRKDEAHEAALARGEDPFSLLAGDQVETAVISAPATEPVKPASKDETPVADKPKAAPKPISRSPAKVEPSPVVEAEKVKKKSTSLYLSGAASRALHTIAAQQGVRPHRVIDDALRAEFKRHGLDFDALNAAD